MNKLIPHFIMRLSIKLDKNIPCEYICKTVHELISKHAQNNELNSDSILIIELKNIIDSEAKLLPAISYTKESID